jgi:hypothetical protein
MLTDVMLLLLLLLLLQTPSAQLRTMPTALCCAIFRRGQPSGRLQCHPSQF